MAAGMALVVGVKFARASVDLWVGKRALRQWFISGEVTVR